jgi:hypothetical protein
MTQTAAVSVASQIRKLAMNHKITADPDSMSRMAVTISGLVGDIVDLDPVEQLLVNLKKKGVLSKSQALAFQGRYLQEKRSKPPSTPGVS